MHREYIRKVAGAKTAVLFIHGIVGTPNHFRDLIPLVSAVPDAWSVHNVLLPGHGGTVAEFAESSVEVWQNHVLDAFEKLAMEHEQVLVVAHSMGTLFALQLAVAHREKIPNLFLLAVPMRPWLRWFGIKNMLRVTFNRIRPDRPLEAATLQACGVKVTRKLWKYLSWIPRYLELFRLIHKTEKQLNDLQVATIAWQSGRDELVSNCSGRILSRYPAIDIQDLPESSHFYYTDADRNRVMQAFIALCEKIEKQD